MTCVIYQYAAKVIQGLITIGDKIVPISPGYYYSSINVHNPWRHSVTYAVKLAISGIDGRPGPVSTFRTFVLGPDQATEFDHIIFESLASPMPAFLESYFVIQCEEELDVVGVYTGSMLPGGDLKKIELEALHMERIPARQLPRCRDLRIDISTGVAHWQLIAPLPANSTLQAGLAPIISHPSITSWDFPPQNTLVNWVGTTGDAGIAPADYIYELKFCLCWTFRNPLLNGTLWADNSAQVYLNNVLVLTAVDPAWQAGHQTQLITTDHFVVGENTLQIKVHNKAGATGMMLSATLSADAADCST